MKTRQNNDVLELVLDGEVATVPIPGGLQSAHGTGLDGVTKVESLKFGYSPDHPGKVFTEDMDSNGSRTTADELFALLQRIAPHYEIRAIKRSE